MEYLGKIAAKTPGIGFDIRSIAWSSFNAYLVQRWISLKSAIDGILDVCL
ncbi:hypothetical protein APHNP_0067 [Anaplasma phagocytophilum str. ApNP]|uniref:Uncharacterized protein n=1 Tax=Anaplasma phagocytophilum str. ApNP TaxID=1359153 RepID=A0A0F3NIM5_ANAPH|nr:hypothetical protein APHNP_0067 [Anaplasma phagocytophilum str. ApNP]